VFFFQAEDGIRDPLVTGVQTCALPILDEEGHLRLERRALERTLPASQHLRHDVLQVLGEREGDPLGADGRDVASRRGRLARERRSEERRVGKEWRCGWGEYRVRGKARE